MERLASRQEGLQAAVVLAHDDRIETLVSTAGNCPAVDRALLGDLETVICDRRLVVLNNLDLVSAPGSERLAWSRATSIAAAPIVSRENSIGFVIVWRNDRSLDLDAQISRMLEAIAYQTSILMESDRLNRQVRESELLAQEVQIASSIQQLLLFGSAPQGHSDIEIAAFSAPSQQVDGDFYDFFQHPDGSFDLVIGDVMGKGVSAALLGAATKTQILRAMADLAMGRNIGPPGPAAIMNRVASSMAGQLMDLERFVTICYARFDFRSGSLILVDCGHTGTIRRRRESGLSFLRGEDLPLGVESDAKFEETLNAARRGDTYLFYSDGITENRSPDGELYGEERLLRCVEAWSSLGPDALVEQIRKEATAFRGSAEFSDDFTCVAVRVRVTKPKEPLLVSRRREFRRELSELPALRSWLRESTDDFTRETVLRMEECCSELFADLVRAGDPTTALAPIVVETTSHESYSTISVGHNRGEFNVQCISAPAFDGPLVEAALPVTRRSADEIWQRHDRDGASVVTLSFARNSAHSRDGLHAAIR
jgi:sigma-B regulation protein RsbU (phosphoserine phosphatase)